MACSYQDVCRLFPFIRCQDNRESIVLAYCNGPGYPDCERYKLKAIGQ